MLMVRSQDFTRAQTRIKSILHRSVLLYKRLLETVIANPSVELGEKLNK